MSARSRSSPSTSSANILEGGLTRSRFLLGSVALFDVAWRPRHHMHVKLNYPIPQSIMLRAHTAYGA
jgi:hypothetical protein